VKFCKLSRQIGRICHTLGRRWFIQEESAPEEDPGCIGKMEWRKM
jgi:hypothetical protein